jgi:hypothetical protein
MPTPSDRTVRFYRDLVIFCIGVAGAIYNLFILPHPDSVAIGVISLFLFGPAALQYREKTKDDE